MVRKPKAKVVKEPRAKGPAKKSGDGASILSYAPAGVSLRDGQVETLLSIESNWNKADVFIVDAPVAAGKSIIATTIARWLYGSLGIKSTIAVPNNLLLKQYTDEFSWLTTLRAQKTYACTDFQEMKQRFSCAKVKQLNGSFCDARSCCYLKDVRKANVMPTGVYNYYTLLAYKMFREVQIFDECIPGSSYVLTKTGPKKVRQAHAAWERGEALEVMSFDAAGNAVWKPVTHGWKRPQGEKRLLKIRTSCSTFQATDNHLVRRLDGTYAAAVDLQPGDELSNWKESGRASGRLVPKSGSRDVLVGSILGDGYWHRDAHCSYGKRLNIRHGKEQLEYLQWKGRVLEESATENGHSGFTGEPQYVVNTSYLVDHVKDKAAAIAALNPRSLAIWFCDDGSRNPAGNSATFHTESWSEEEILLAKSKLAEFGIDSVLQVSKKADGRSYVVIRLRKAAVGTLLALIAPFTPACMAYKVRPLDCSYEYPVEDCGYEDISASYVEAIEELPPVDFVYDFEVADNHNFCVTSVQNSSSWTVVHNCHNVINVLRDAAGKKLWRHDYNYPDYIHTYGQLHTWVSAHPDVGTDRKLKLLKEELEAGRTSFLVERTEDLYHGQLRDVIKLNPVDVSDYPPMLWPEKKTKKLIMLSATMNLRDIKDLGLDKRRVMTISTRSPIPVERRPCLVDTRFNMSYHNQERELPRVAAALLKFLEENPERGFIHAPYGLATKLREAIDRLALTEPQMKLVERLLFHTSGSKIAQFEHYKVTPGAVLVASGMAEGVSLGDDLGRWQIILKVPWPSLAEPAIKWKAENDEEWYLNSTGAQVSQAYGRICRSPSDIGVTLIWDKSFVRLWKNAQQLFPTWFKEAVQFD